MRDSRDAVGVGGISGLRRTITRGDLAIVRRSPAVKSNAAAPQRPKNHRPVRLAKPIPVCMT
jgi:hypothetical protein